MYLLYVPLRDATLWETTRSGAGPKVRIQREVGFRVWGLGFRVFSYDRELQRLTN